MLLVKLIQCAVGEHSFFLFESHIAMPSIFPNSTSMSCARSQIRAPLFLLRPGATSGLSFLHIAALASFPPGIRELCNEKINAVLHKHGYDIDAGLHAGLWNNLYPDADEAAYEEAANEDTDEEDAEEAADGTAVAVAKQDEIRLAHMQQSLQNIDLESLDEELAFRFKANLRRKCC